MGSAMKNMVPVKYSSEMNPLGWIYPSNLRDKLNKATIEKRWTFYNAISGFYEINSTNGVF